MPDQPQMTVIPKLRVLSLGAGVQSTTLALMAERCEAAILDAVEAEKTLIKLIKSYYLAEIGRLMHQAEHWAADGKPLAVHHRIGKADAYYQIVALMDRDDPFAEMRRSVDRRPIFPEGIYPPSAEIHAYRDPAYVIGKLDHAQSCPDEECPRP